MTQTLPANLTDMRLSDLLKVQGITIVVNVTAEMTPPPVIMPPPPPTERMLRIGEVKDKVGMSEAWIYQSIKDGAFPAPKKSGRSNRWPESDIDRWMEGR